MLIQVEYEISKQSRYVKNIQTLLNKQVYQIYTVLKNEITSFKGV
jgi:hypothetical protein